MPKKLCKWSKKKIRRETGRLQHIVSAPRYLCRKCARVAADKRYLCKSIMINAVDDGAEDGAKDGS